jgi:hypothetical protein
MFKATVKNSFLAFASAEEVAQRARVLTADFTALERQGSCRDDHLELQLARLNSLMNQSIQPSVVCDTEELHGKWWCDATCDMQGAGFQCGFSSLKSSIPRIDSNSSVSTMVLDDTCSFESGSSEPSTREASVSPRIVTHEMPSSDCGALQTSVQIETSSTPAHLGMVVNMIPVQVTGVLQVPVLPMQPSSKQSAQHSRHADEMDEVARAWLLRAELAKSAVENLRVHMDLRANQAENRNSLVQPGTAMLQIPLTEESLGSLALPSRGSEHHATGNCNPCAWFHSNKGCHNGAMCDFCHACGRGEIKRRRKQQAKLHHASKQK